MKKFLFLLFLTGIICCENEPSLSTRLIFNLNDMYDSTNAEKDVQVIRKMNGVKEAVFISKEMAKQIYLEDGNESWDKVLDYNPLPASVYVDTNNKLTDEQIIALENKIKQQLQWVESVRKIEIKPK
jgi:cell division protein FtsX